MAYTYLKNETTFPMDLAREIACYCGHSNAQKWQKSYKKQINKAFSWNDDPFDGQDDSSFSVREALQSFDTINDDDQWILEHMTKKHSVIVEIGYNRTDKQIDIIEYWEKRLLPCYRLRY